MNVRKSGIIAIRLKTGDALKWVSPSSGEDQIILVSASGQSIRFKEKDIRKMGRTASGIRGSGLKKSDSIVGLDIIKKGNGEIAEKNQRLLVLTENGFGKQTPLKEYKVQHRGGGGIRTAKTTDKTGLVIAVHIVDDSIEEILAFSSKGQALRTKLKDIRIAGRSTQGVRIMNLEKGDKLNGIVCL